ncbi:MAG: MFS transporter [Anaerolineae bacterium]|nr:MFS transporter [Anaerolineae bacterium]
MSRVGSAIARFALVWWLTDLTGSAAVLASASALSLIPQIVLGPLAGAYVDRWNRRMTMILSDGVIALLSLLLAWLFWSGNLEIWHVYVIMIARAFGDIFHRPATQAAVTMLVPREQLPRVHGLNQTLAGAIEIVGPPLGALALAVMKLDQVMFVDVITAIIAIVPLLFVHIPEPVRAISVRATTVWRDLAEGLRYIWGLPGVVAVIVMAVAMNFAGAPTWTLLPLYVRNVFGGGATELSIVESAQGAGLILGGVALSLWGHRSRSRVVQSFGGFLLAGVAGFGMALAPSAALWILVASWLIFGVFNAIGNGTIIALLQGAIAPEMQGRVNSAVSSLVMLATPIGLAISAPVVERFGLRSWYLFAAVVCTVGPLWALLSPHVRQLDYIRPDADQRSERGTLPRDVAPKAPPIMGDTIAE